MNNRKKFLVISLILFVVAVVYTVLVKKADVKAIGPNGSEVGFASLNSSVRGALNYGESGYNETFYKISKLCGLLPFLLVALYGIIGLKQLITEKSLAKVDKRLIAMGGFYVAFAIVYVFFEKVAVNFRPVIMDGELEASYPSTHTLLAICLCGSSILASKYLIENETLRKIINIISAIVMVVIVVTRLLSGVHWTSDIIGGIIISAFMLTTLNIFLVNKED